MVEKTNECIDTIADRISALGDSIIDR